MARRAAKTFFVESYVPGLDQAVAAALSSRLRAAIDDLQRDGRMIAWLRSFALVDEETFVWMVTATEAEDIARVNRRARVPYDHVVEAVPGEASRSHGRSAYHRSCAVAYRRRGGG